MLRGVRWGRRALLGLAVPLAVAPLAWGSAQAQDPQTVRIGHIFTPGSEVNKGMEEFARIVEEQTDGRYDFEILPSSQLGSALDLMQQVSDGSLEISIIGPSGFAPRVPPISMLEAPFVARDFEHLERIFNSDVVQGHLTTLSDDFRIMWEPQSLEDPTRQLVHRCFVDSEAPRDHGCVTRALDYSEGSLDFASKYIQGELDGYSEDEFLENLGMFLGVASHHIADLCTPVHVGHKIDYVGLGFRSLSRLHSKVERDIGRLASRVPLKLARPKKIKLESPLFWQIATDTYEKWFVRLPEIYGEPDQQLLEEMVGATITEAVRHTANVWRTVLEDAGMLGQEWSQQPLL